MNISFSPLVLMAVCLRGVFIAWLAWRRGRNPYIWFFIGFFFGIWGVFALFFAPMKNRVLSKSGPAMPTEPEKKIKGPSDKFWYYLDTQHQQVGPMSFNAIGTAWKQGKISLKTYVWHEELPEWKLLQELVITSSLSQRLG